MATSVEYVVNATDAASKVFEKISLSTDNLGRHLDALDRRIAAPEVDLKDAKFTQGMIRAAERLDKLSAKVADPKVEVDGGEAAREILKINAMLDRLGAKRVDVKVDVNRSFLSRIGGLFGGGQGGWLSGLFSSGAAAGGAGAQGGTGFAGSLGQIGTPLLYGGLTALAAALAPALLPLGLGGLSGFGAGGLALTLGAKGGPLLQADRQALARAQLAIQSATAPGTASASQLLTLHQAQQRLAAATTPAQRLAAQQAIARAQASIASTTAPGTASASQLLTLHQAQQKMAHDQAIYGEFAPLNQALSGLGRTALGTFASALESRGPGFSAGGGQPGAPSFLTSLKGILEQIGRFIKSIGPQLGDLFRASVPYLQTFVKFLEQAAKVLLPVFTNMLKQMTPYLPLISKGFTALLQGLADMLKAMGPQGMEASAKIFVGLMKAVGGILTVAGKAINFFAVAVQDVAHWLMQHWKVVEWLVTPVVTAVTLIVRHWDDFRLRFMAILGNVQHGFAQLWDLIWNNTVGRAIRGGHDIEREWNTWTHNIGVIFDAFRHSVATVWDLIWNNTVGRTERGISDVVGWLKKLPGEGLAALRGFGTSLFNFAHAALDDFLSGLKSVGGTVLGWLRNFIGGIPHAIMSFLHMSPPHPGSVFYDLGANLMHHLEAGIKSRASSVAGSIKGVSGSLGGSVNSWITEALHLAHEPLSWLPALQRLVSLESGGNPNAVNPISVLGQHASGLWQMLPSTFASYGGTGSLFNPVVEGVAALRYIAATYGSPFNIPGLFSGGYQGYETGSWNVPYTGPAVVHAGEMIIPAAAAAAIRAGGGGNTYQITLNVPPTADKAGIGRQVVETIKEFERRSGAGWRS